MELEGREGKGYLVPARAVVVGPPGEGGVSDAQLLPDAPQSDDPAPPGAGQGGVVAVLGRQAGVTRGELDRAISNQEYTLIFHIYHTFYNPSYLYPLILYIRPHYPGFIISVRLFPPLVKIFTKPC